MVPGTIGEVPSGTTIGREGLILELVKIEALGFITNHPIEGHGVGAHPHILGDNDHLGTVVE